MSDDIVVRLREVSPSEDAEQASYLLTDAADEILSYRGTVRALDEEIERLREMVNSIANAQDGWGRVPRLEAEIERLRKCLQHAIDHVGKWGLFTAEEKQAVLAEYEQAVRGD